MVEELQCLREYEPRDSDELRLVCINLWRLQARDDAELFLNLLRLALSLKFKNALQPV